MNTLEILTEALDASEVDGTSHELRRRLDGIIRRMKANGRTARGTLADRRFRLVDLASVIAALRHNAWRCRILGDIERATWYESRAEINRDKMANVI